MARKVKYNTFKLLQPNGEWETIKVPLMFGADDVAAHQPQSVIAMLVPEGYRVSVAGSLGDRIVEGPRWVVWNPEAKEWANDYADIESTNPSCMNTTT
jgi:hypothetical protein